MQAAVKKGEEQDENEFLLDYDENDNKDKRLRGQTLGIEGLSSETKELLRKSVFLFMNMWPVSDWLK